MEECGVIDFSALDRELQSALQSDRKYQRENDAKFRAVHQKVSSYEEFRDIVLASHLKPLDKKDISGAPPKRPWNSLSAGPKKQKGTTAETVQSQLPDFKPSTLSEFTREWSRCGRCSEEKYDLLVRLGGETLRTLFSTEVAFGLLGEFLTALSQGLRSGDEVAVTAVLEGLSKTGRFGLNVSLLSQTEQEACKALFCRLRGSAKEGQEVWVESEDGSKRPSIAEGRAAPQCEEQLRRLMAAYGCERLA